MNALLPGRDKRLFARAIEVGNAAIVQALLTRRCIRLQTKTNDPLVLACKLGKVDVVWALLDFGADVDTRDSDGHLPLTEAIKANQIDTITLLLQHGTDVNLKTKTGRYPLLLASMKGQTFVLRALLRSEGVDINVCNLQGNSALTTQKAQTRVM